MQFAIPGDIFVTVWSVWSDKVLAILSFWENEIDFFWKTKRFWCCRYQVLKYFPKSVFNIKLHNFPITNLHHLQVLSNIITPKTDSRN